MLTSSFLAGARAADEGDHRLYLRPEWLDSLKSLFWEAWGSQERKDLKAGL